MKNYSNTCSIKNWAEDDRPREKLLLKGKSILSDAELIAILIGSGNKTESAVDLAKTILRHAKDNLIELSKLSVHDLIKFNGIGEAKAIAIIAALELGKRRLASAVLEREKILHSTDAYKLFRNMLSDKRYEEFWILLLNKANKIIRKVNISEGGLTGTVADPKKIFKIAIDNFACSIILCHNHPSGNPNPSDADIKLTKKLTAGGVLLDIAILDHIICCEENYFSFADEGMLK